jgi:WD40 repeat protein
VGVILVILSVIGTLIISANAQIPTFVQIVTAISWRGDSEQFIVAYGWQRIGEGECPNADLILYDLNGLSTVLKSTHSCMITGAVYSSDDSNLISAGIDGTTVLWDATTLNEIQSSLYFGSIMELSISPKINQIAALRDGARIKITRIDSNQFGDSIILGEGISYITDIAWHPEGGIIATSDLDGFIKFGDADSASRLE